LHHNKCGYVSGAKPSHLAPFLTFAAPVVPAPKK